MDSPFIELLLPLSFWHWLALALILLAIEMALGTFDLLMVSVAAAFTSAWAGLAPQGLAGWEAQLLVFFIATVIMIVLGRTVFARMRTGGPGEPLLNRRMARMLGQRGEVVSDFASGQGRVRIGDTEWMAESLAGDDLPAGTAVVVEGAQSTTVFVRQA